MTSRPDLSKIRNNNILVMGKKTNNKPRNRPDNFGWDFDMTVHRSVPPGPPDLTNPPDMDTIRAVSDFNTINTDNSVDNKAIVSEEPKLSKEDPQETRHLKELLLLHLEWIQQQQEALLSKDRQIQRLKQEKDAVSLRFWTNIHVYNAVTSSRVLVRSQILVSTRSDTSSVTEYSRMCINLCFQTSRVKIISSHSDMYFRLLSVVL